MGNKNENQQLTLNDVLRKCNGNNTQFIFFAENGLIVVTEIYSPILIIESSFKMPDEDCYYVASADEPNNTLLVIPKHNMEPICRIVDGDSAFQISYAGSEMALHIYA